MSRYNTADDRTLARALIVDAYGAVSWDEYLRDRSRADDGRDPTTA